MLQAPKSEIIAYKMKGLKSLNAPLIYPPGPKDNCLIFKNLTQQQTDPWITKHNPIADRQTGTLKET